MVNEQLKYHITNNEGNIISNNIDSDFISSIAPPLNRIETTLCPDSGKSIRHGLFEFDFGSVYLLSYDENISNRIFKRYFEICLIFIPILLKSEQEFKKRESQNFRRLRHNLVTHNTNILQELENTFYSAGEVKGAQNQKKFIKDTFKESPDAVALSLLKVFKSANLMKTDFDVYDMVNSNIPYVEFDKHPIHRILVSVIRPFWLDLLEKEVNINIRECTSYVYIDYKSISVVFTYLFDNLVKYIAVKSDLNISFKDETEKMIITIEMTSLKITEKDKKHIFDENYSGEYASKIGKAGDGIGMFMVKKLVELNKGTVEIRTNVYSPKNVLLMGIPFERNQIVISLNKN